VENHAEEVSGVENLDDELDRAGFTVHWDGHTHVRPYISDMGARTRGYRTLTQASLCRNESHPPQLRWRAGIYSESSQRPWNW
jgi:hypothetical protein